MKWNFSRTPPFIGLSRRYGQKRDGHMVLHTLVLYRAGIMYMYIYVHHRAYTTAGEMQTSKWARFKKQKYLSIFFYSFLTHVQKEKKLLIVSRIEIYKKIHLLSFRSCSHFPLITWIGHSSSSSITSMMHICTLAEVNNKWLNQRTLSIPLSLFFPILKYIFIPLYSNTWLV